MEIKSREKLGTYFKSLGFEKGAEIGVEQGIFTETLCSAGLEIYAIDAWTVYAGYNDFVDQRKLDEFHQKAKDRLASFNCHIIKAFSMDAVKKFKDESLDFVYIDCNHEFQHATNDIAEWSKKVRKGGIVSGHDFKRFSGEFGLKSCHIKDVVPAWCNAHQLKLQTTKEGIPSWFYVK